ncbi:MAG: GntR family transcriptional regulator [Porticoccaceae bacterium]
MAISTEPAGLARLKTPATLNAAASDQLREAIVTGRLAPGAQLKDGEVAAWLGLSATPVREALVRLAAEGLVEIEPNRSKRVAPIDHQAMVELLQVQNELWALGYAWGAPRIGKAELAVLDQLCGVHRDAIDAGDPRGAVAAAHGFHRVLMEASGNRELVRVSVDRLPLIQRYVLLCVPTLIVPEMSRQHRAMVKALRGGDSAAAIAIFRAISEDLLRAAERLRDQGA